MKRTPEEETLQRAWECGLPGYLQRTFYTAYFAARAAALFHVT